VKLWGSGLSTDDQVERFTADEDRLLDQRLVRFDAHASIAHAHMLQSIGVLERQETEALVAGLEQILSLDEQGQFPLQEGDEDCHSAIERHLTETVGEAGKKLHLGRSRNDQVLVAMRLYEREALASIDAGLEAFDAVLAARVERDGGTAMPGYTHMQRAMPSSIGMWLGSYRAAVADDRTLLRAVVEVLDQNPLGTAAGFGVPVFELDREMTTRELGFHRVLDNPMYAQLSRGKLESSILHVISQVLLALNRLASDLLLFSTVEFAYVRLPIALCTGSSIMPQKKNADVLELVRARYHEVLGAEMQVKSLVGNLMSGYHRDLQLTKGPVLRSLDTAGACVAIMTRVVDELAIDHARCEAAVTPEVRATEDAYRLVADGMPFRDAYREIAKRFAK
jgi:argininosuccinate lyase